MTDTVFANPLKAGLTDQQERLLRLIALPTDPQWKGGWPVWDYVRRSFDGDAWTVWQTLPTIPRAASPRRAYGLVWAMEQTGAEPGGSELVGLSVAGLLRIDGPGDDVPGRIAKTLADAIGKLIGQLAIAEVQITPDPAREVSSSTHLAALQKSLIPNLAEAWQPTLVDEVFFDLLSKELPGLAVTRMTSPAGLNVELGRILRPYRDVADADSLLAVHARGSAALPPPASRPDQLPLLMDFAGHVLGTAGAITGHRIVAKMAVTPILSLAAEAATAEAAKTALMDFASMLEHIPAVGTGPKPLARLHAWSQPRLDVGPASEMAAATGVLVDIVTIRQWLAHADTSALNRAHAAAVRLGLDFPIADRLVNDPRPRRGRVSPNPTSGRDGRLTGRPMVVCRSAGMPSARRLRVAPA